MAKSKASKKKDSTNKQREIEAKDHDNPFEKNAEVQEETSSDGKFSEYERQPSKDRWDGDLILQYRGAPKE
jgi:hypothetical protein